MTTQRHATGEEYMAKLTTGEDSANIPTATTDNFGVLLFDDGTDTLTNSDDIGDIANEPSQTGSGYARQSASVTVSISGDSVFLTMPTVSFASLASFSASFDVTAYGVIPNSTWTSSVTGVDGGDVSHLFWTGSLSQSRNLADFDQLNLASIRGELTT